MDTRILMLLVFISVAGSLAEAHVPFYRVRRNGLQESDITAGREFVETPRAKRQSIFESSSTAESTATPKPKDTTTVSAPSTTPKKPTPPSKPTPSNPRQPDATPETSKPNPTTRAAKPTTRKAAPTTPASESAEETATPEPTSSEASEEQTSTTPKVGLGSRIDSDDEPAQVKKPQTNPQTKSQMKPQMKPQTRLQTNPAPSAPTSSYPQNGDNPSSLAFPNLAPDYSSPYNPYGDPTFNSIPGPNNYAWTGTHNGNGAAASFASAGASAGGFGAGGNYGFKQPPSLADRGAFVDNTPNTANSNTGYTPNAGYVPYGGYVPFMGNAGGFGYSGVGSPFPDPSSFAFPGYNPNQFQMQMEDYFKQLQNQFQQQQQSLFETANRIGTDGYQGQPGSHTAVSSIRLGPQGGYQAGAINPVAPGVQSRFGEEIPAPSGGNVAVFSSSSSNTRIGPDGKPVSHKTSTTGVNDNGKITFRTVED